MTVQNLAVKKKDKSVLEAKVWNKVCPISGEPVDPSIETVSYNGKNFGFCNGCIFYFKAESEKHYKNLSQDRTKHLGT